MAIAPQRLTVRGFHKMVDSLAPDADPLSVFLLNNARLEMGVVTQRYGWNRQSTTTLGTAGTGNNGVAYEWTKLDGTTKTIIVQNGQVYLVSNALIPTVTLTAAQLTAAGITIAVSTVFCVPFANQLVFSDGVNVPFIWDGTDGGGLTLLTNTPVAFGSPTVYYARLFFIKASDHGTIVWSEVNQPNVGYEAGGYNNAWTLAQTGTEPLCAILGTNEQLYYWRNKSIGAIRGAVTSTFSTDGTHDGVAVGLGHSSIVSASGATLYRAQPVYHNSYIWWYDNEQKPWRMALGGAPEPVWLQLERRMRTAGYAALYDKPYNLSEDTGWNYPHGIVADQSKDLVYVMSGTGADKLALVFHGTTGQLLGTEVWSNLGVVGFTTLGSVLPGAHGLFANGSNVVVCYGMPAVALQWGTDHYSTASSSTYTTTVIGPAQGYDEAIDWTFDEIDVVYQTNKTDANALLKVDYLTDQAHYSTLMAAQQSVSAYDATYQVKEQRARFGINGCGAWIRVRVQLSSSARLALLSWSVLGFPVSDTVGAP